MYIFSTHHRFWNIYVCCSLSLFSLIVSMFPSGSQHVESSVPRSSSQTQLPLHSVRTITVCMVHVGGTRAVTWSIDHQSIPMQVRMGTELIRTNLFLVFWFDVWLAFATIRKFVFHLFICNTIHSFFFLLLAMFGLPGTPCCCSVTKRCPPTPLWPRGKATVWVGRWAG
jgi:hypothetical protein